MIRNAHWTACHGIEFREKYGGSVIGIDARASEKRVDAIPVHDKTI